MCAVYPPLPTFSIMVTFLYISSFNVPPQTSKNHELHLEFINFTQIIPFRQGYPDSASSNSVLKHFNYYSLHCRIITVMNSKWKARLEERWKSKLTHSSWQYCAPFLASGISLLIFHQTCGVFLIICLFSLGVKMTRIAVTVLSLPLLFVYVLQTVNTPG